MNCDPIARAYRWLEYGAFGRELERRRFRFLASASGARNALVLGDGDGRFLERLLAAAPSAHIELVDSSRRMLELARERTHSPRVIYRHLDARRLDPPPARFDLVSTHFFLDCFGGDELRDLIGQLSRSAQPGAQWLISEFRQPARGWRAAWAWLWLRSLYFFFGIATGLQVRRLTDHRPLLERSGFRLEHSEEAWFGLLASELWRKA
jgi:ubiquinone/menaquinone biosynthesis C-methylase UbiE